MANTLFFLLFMLPLFILFVGASITLIFLLIRALRRYLADSSHQHKVAASCSQAHSLGEAILEHRTRCGMTQEFVAEQLGVSRQAVSKWEQNKTDPSTSNLLALAKLFGISPEELLHCTQ